MSIHVSIMILVWNRYKFTLKFKDIKILNFEPYTNLIKIDVANYDGNSTWFDCQCIM